MVAPRLALLTLALLAAGAAPSRAGDPASPGGGLEPPGVADVLGREGYRDIRVLRRRGALWLADAEAPRGRRMRAVVDAYTGEITGLKPLDGKPLAPPAP